MSERKIYIDVDGVLANLNKSMFWLYDKRQPDDLDIVCRDAVVKLLNLKKSNDVFKVLKNVSPEWWEKIDPYPWCFDIIDEVKKTGLKYYFYTKGTYNSSSYAGKHKWIYKHFGTSGLSRLYIITGENKKSEIAKAGDILIDDLPKNLQEWQDAGGIPFHWEPCSKRETANKQLKNLSAFLSATCKPQSEFEFAINEL